MAAEMVIGPVVSASIKFLIGKITSSDLGSYLRGKKGSGFDGLLQKLETKFLSLSAVLADAELKQIRNPAVEMWLDKLQDAVDDAEDLFDDIEYDALKLKVEAESRTGISKVRNVNFLSTIYNSTDRKRKTKMEEILAKLEDFEKERYILDLKEDVKKISSQRPPSTSLIDDSEVYGRDDEKDALKKTLLSDEVGSQKICVIPIVGMGGIGKTTLAQAVYNDDDVNEYFVLKAWVCVSDEFDVCKVTKSVLEAITRKACDVDGLDVLQVKIQEELKEKKFLIVLDDIWNENDDFWDRMRMPFKVGAQGSKIIATTRSKKVASIMGTVGSRHLEELKEEACLKLLAKLASGVEDLTINSDLERIGKEIVKKCKGLPLAVKALGGLLRSTHVEEWERIAKSDILDLPNQGNNILPALRLSYYYLPPHLKRCFAYCSLFPKDYEFGKEELVLLWMAENLLENPRKNMEIEEVGVEYCNDLVSRSFLQRSSTNRSRFVMHDLIVDLARLVSKKKYFLIEKGKSNEIVLMKQARHIAYDKRSHNQDDMLKSIVEATYLRTFFLLHGCFTSTKLQLHDLLKLRCLRYLSLNAFRSVKHLPKSVGELRHLRYLDLSLTAIKVLPESLCKLYNLQTLKLSHCYFLTKLPNNLHRLINLRYLDVEGSAVVEMPTHISKLKSLQNLIVFIVGKKTGAKIEELGELSDLRGGLSIHHLENLRANDACAAKLRDKKYLEVLNLYWYYKTSVSEHGRRVLDNLLPNKTLKELSVNNYGGTTFPEWLGNQSFCCLVGLSLFNCEFCHTMPPLGQLPSLKTLLIRNFDAIETVGIDFYGTCSSVVKPFASLESLEFAEMSNWKEWSVPVENCIAFPKLRTLSLENCQRLTGDLPWILPSLIELSIADCRELASSLPIMPAVRKVSLSDCNRLKGFRVLESFSCLQNTEIIDYFDPLKFSYCPTNLTSLHIEYCENFNFPPRYTYESLEGLSITTYSCASMKSLSLDSFPNIRNLTIGHCQNLESFTLCEGLKSLSSLRVANCHSFTLFPNLSCPILTRFELHNCEKLKSLPDQLHSLLPSLQVLEISYCPELESLPRYGLPFTLRELYICNCDKVISSRKNWNLQALPHLIEFFIFMCGCEDVESFPEEGLLPTTITHLKIRDIGCLKTLDKKGFQQLTSLKSLRIFDCPKLQTLPEEGLPASLEILIIIDSPLMKEKCQKEKGEYWNKIARIPLIFIDNERIQGPSE